MDVNYNFSAVIAKNCVWFIKNGRVDTFQIFVPFQERKMATRGLCLVVYFHEVTISVWIFLHWQQQSWGKNCCICASWLPHSQLVAQGRARYAIGSKNCINCCAIIRSWIIVCCQIQWIHRNQHFVKVFYQYKMEY